MIPAAAFLIGAAWGALLARRRQGNRADQLHYAAIYGIAFAVVGVFAGVLIGRLL